MKNFLLSFFILAVTVGIKAQEMRWVPTADLNGKLACSDATDCTRNIVCYSLAYLPAVSGKLTSYTAGFRVDCDGGETSIVKNEACSMADNSRQVVACGEVGELQLLSCGNTGDVSVTAGKAVYLHQICLQTQRKGPGIRIAADPLMGVTTSIDLAEGVAVTETPGFAKSYFQRNRLICQNGTAEGLELGKDLDSERLTLSLSPNPAIDWLQVVVDVPSEDVNLRIMDSQGCLVLQQLGPGQRRETLNVSRLPAGTYYLSVGEEYPSLSRKFVIVR